jgi:hypothetical protein
MLQTASAMDAFPAFGRDAPSYMGWTQSLTAQPSYWRVNGLHKDKELP